MVGDMLENLYEVVDMEKVKWHFRMETNIRGIGMKAEGRAMDFIYFQMAIGKFLNRTKILFVVYETFCILDFVDTFGF